MPSSIWPPLPAPCALPNHPLPQQPTRRQCLAWGGAAGLAPLLAACGGDGDGLAATKAWGREAIRKTMQETGARAVSIALLVDGEVAWQEAFGVTDEAAGTPATTATRFNVGSVSKVLAALAVAILVDRKLVRLDAPITDYLPGFSMRSPGFRDIRLRHLLSHSSGLPGTHAHNLFATTHLPGYAAELEAALADVHLKHAPGELAVYCNDGFTLTERVVQAVTGQSFPEFVQTQILAPLGMAQSGYTLQPLPAGSFAHGYLNGERQDQEFVMGYATGGLCTTPGDMLRLGAMFLGGGQYRGTRIVSEAGVAEMARDQTLGLRINPSPEWRWGLGWDSVRQPGLDAAGVLAWQKNGGTTLYASDFFVLPHERMAFVITGSGTAYNPGRLAEGILLRALQERGRLAALPPAVASTPPAPVDAAPATVQAALGIYGRSEAPLKALSPDGQRIDLWTWSPQGWTLLREGLRLRSDGWWWPDAGPGLSYRWQQAGGHTYLIARQPGGAGHYRLTMALGQRLSAAPGPLPAAWQARLGRPWKVLNEAPQSFVIRLGGGQIALGELPDLPGYLLWDNAQLLLPLADDRAGMAVQVPTNFGRDLVELVATREGGQDTLRSGGWVLQRPG